MLTRILLSLTIGIGMVMLAVPGTASAHGVVDLDIRAARDANGVSLPSIPSRPGHLTQFFTPTTVDLVALDVYALPPEDADGQPAPRSGQLLIVNVNGEIVASNEFTYAPTSTTTPTRIHIDVPGPIPTIPGEKYSLRLQSNSTDRNTFELVTNPDHPAAHVDGVQQTGTLRLTTYSSEGTTAPQPCSGSICF